MPTSEKLSKEQQNEIHRFVTQNLRYLSEVPHLHFDSFLPGKSWWALASLIPEVLAQTKAALTSHSRDSDLAVCAIHLLQDPSSYVAGRPSEQKLSTAARAKLIDASVPPLVSLVPKAKLTEWETLPSAHFCELFGWASLDIRVLGFPLPRGQDDQDNGYNLAFQ